VRKAIDAGVELAALPLDAFRAESDAFTDDIFEWLDVAAAVDRRDVTGGPARGRIEHEIARIREELT
jgi:argininosuccinate lyase